MSPVTTAVTPEARAAAITHLEQVLAARTEALAVLAAQRDLAARIPGPRRET